MFRFGKKAHQLEVEVARPALTTTQAVLKFEPGFQALFFFYLIRHHS